MALISEWMQQCGKKVLDNAGIVREAIYRQLRRSAYQLVARITSCLRRSHSIQSGSPAIQGLIPLATQIARQTNVRPAARRNMPQFTFPILKAEAIIQTLLAKSTRSEIAISRR